MPILSTLGRRSLGQRLIVATLYAVLTLLGASMVVPFLMTITSSISNDYDYQSFRPVPRYLYSENDRFVKGLVGYFNDYAKWPSQLAAQFPGVPRTWSGWSLIGRDQAGGDALASRCLASSGDAAWRTQARDYADFADTYPIEDTLAPINPNLVADYLEDSFEKRWAEQDPRAAAHAAPWKRRTAALDLLSETWGTPFPEFRLIKFDPELASPVWQQSWLPPSDPKYASFLELKQAYKDLRFTPGAESLWKEFLVRNHAYEARDFVFPVSVDSPPALRALWLRFKEEVLPASPAIPYALRVEWRNYLEGEAVRDKLALGRTEVMDVAHYNALAGTHYGKWEETPFPVPADAPPRLQALWGDFVARHYPLRLVTLTPSPELAIRYQHFLESRFKGVVQANALLGTSFGSWDQFPLSAVPPVGAPSLQGVWLDFVKTLPIANWKLSSSEASFQQFLLGRYGTLDAINAAWGTSYAHAEEIFPPFSQAYAVTFRNDQWAMTLQPMVSNYEVIADYLLLRGSSLPVTLLLVILAIFCSLTINPIAAYALSRFNLRGQETILLFLLATSAFPAMISAIPGYLLMRDLGLLNTFFALVLPGAASGMAIFILKGFFDSLPPELFEAATIDGAKEWQIFLHVTMPMVKPILAINALTAFLSAYTGWEWALIICQNPKMWTLAVWMYQASQWWATTPWIVNAGFILVSIPTLIVFLTCQNIILRGIIIPQMK